MTRWGALSIVLLAPAAALAQDNPDSRHPISAENNWSLTDSDCAIDASWDGDVAVLITRHDDHHDLGVYNPRFKGVASGKTVMVRLGTGPGAEPRELEAATYNDNGSKSFVVAADDALLDAAASSNVLQLYRGKATLADLDLSGFAQALAAMRACEAAQAPGDAVDAAAAAVDSETVVETDVR